MKVKFSDAAGQAEEGQFHGISVRKNGDMEYPIVWIDKKGGDLVGVPMETLSVMQAFIYARQAVINNRTLDLTDVNAMRRFIGQEPYPDIAA